MQRDCFDLVVSDTDDFHCIDASCGVSLDFILWLFALEPAVDQWSLLLQALGVHLEISSQVWYRRCSYTCVSIMVSWCVVTCGARVITCCMLTCYMLHAACSMQHATCNTHAIVRNQRLQMPFLQQRCLNGFELGLDVS